MNILAGDIGGTKTRVALLIGQNDKLETVREETYPSRDYASLHAILHDFLTAPGEPPQAAGFALAGPVQGRRCRVTNLPWMVDANELEQRFAIPQVTLLNDLEATAWGVDALGAEDLLTLTPGTPGASGNRAVIAAGTGLGQAGLFWNGERHIPFASEGGHCDFAPRSELEIALLHHLQPEFGQVSWERLVSGPGIVRIYHFLCEYRNSPPSEALACELSSRDPAAVIAEKAGQQADAICVETMALFTRLYGAEAGNHALKMMATGGVYIGGGIAPKILPWLQTQTFLEAFRSKGQMRELLEGIAVRVILNDRAALWGSARCLLSRSSPDS